MMRQTVQFVFLLASMFITSLAHANDTITDEKGRALAANTVAKATGIAVTELNTKRLESTEDELFLLQRKIVGHIQKGAWFYEVENGGWQITPEEATYSPPSQSWYVAVAVTDGETFGLFGFPNATNAFQQLVKKIPVEVTDTVGASLLAKFYLKTVYRNTNNIVYDELWLRHQVEDHFVGYANSQEPVTKKEQRYREWWTRFKSKNTGPLAPSTTLDGNDQYRAVFKILSMTVGRPPELSQWSIQVTGSGMAELKNKQPVFPAKTISKAAGMAPWRRLGAFFPVNAK